MSLSLSPYTVPIAKELSTSIGVPMEGFFEGADVMFGTIAFATSAIAQRVVVEAPIPSTKPVPMEGTHTKGIGEDTPISTETPIPQEGVIPSTA